MPKNRKNSGVESRVLDMRPDKSLGQHFLHDRRVLERIAGTLPGVAEAPYVVEIGPGPGALTAVLLEKGYRLGVVEKDPRWQNAMLELAENGRAIEFLADDALTADWGALLQPRDDLAPVVVGNLPYNVGTEIVASLALLAAQGRPYPAKMVYMLQKEVVLRICAQPGGEHAGHKAGRPSEQRDWGRLGVLCDLLCERELLFDVAPGAFNPPPKVMSSVVRLTPLPAPRYQVDLRKLDRVLRLAFGQRRKMLRASLKGVLTEDQLLAAGVAPTARPEVVSTAQFCALAGMLQGSL